MKAPGLAAGTLMRPYVVGRGVVGRSAPLAVSCLAPAPFRIDSSSMRLAILRHGPAVDRADWHQDDALRPLTDRGREGTTEVCHALARVISPQLILSSSWIRAAQTAAIASACLDTPSEFAPWLAGESLDLPTVLTELTRREHSGTTDLMLVGHEPGLGHLIGALLNSPPLPLKKAGWILLDGEPQVGGMQMLGLLSAKLTRKLSAP